MMNQTITAVFENGVFTPETSLDLAAGCRVRLTIEPLDTVSSALPDAWEELERLCEDSPIDSGGERLTRDQLHERH
jgi:predicted DNA-binding antitoxin AbrB/MazE fold protein